MNTTVVRILSAAVALLIFFGLYYQFALDGVKAFILAVALIGQWEYAELTFLRENRTHSLPLLFIFVAGAQLIAQSFLSFHPLILVGGGSLLFALGIWLLLLRANTSQNLERAFTEILSFVTGLIYLGVLPGTIFAILNQNQGIQWLVTLMAIVFLGDTTAYFSGLQFGKSKILPNLSPKKTKIGCLGGLTGSVVAGAICHFAIFPNSTNLWLFLLVAGVAGLLGQAGDFFESLLKRVAGVKDSGRIMPGHGGVLDRVDAILFAAPALLWLTLQPA